MFDICEHCGCEIGRDKGIHECAGALAAQRSRILQQLEQIDKRILQLPVTQ